MDIILIVKPTFGGGSNNSSSNNNNSNNKCITSKDSKSFISSRFDKKQGPVVKINFSVDSRLHNF